MSTLSTFPDKSNEFRQIYQTLPDILIQDPYRNSTFFIPAEKLATFECNANTWSQLNSGTVTFVIPNGELFEEIPPFVDPSVSEPSVLIQYRKDQKAYFLTYDQLKDFRIDLSGDQSENYSGLTFIIPAGWELIQELPAVRRALLQSNTNVHSY